MKLAFVTNICPHYRVKTFERLASHFPTRYYFFSSGEEWYWQAQHGTRGGAFDHHYLKGREIAGTRLTPSLVKELWRDDYDVLIKCINGRFALPVSYLIARLRRKPFVLWTGIWMRLQTPFHRLIWPITRYIYRHADAVVVYGNHVKQFLVGEGVTPERIFVAPHAIDNEAYSGSIPPAKLDDLRGELGLRPEERVILYLGRLEPVKGLHYLLEAFARIEARDAVLVLVGEGSEKGSLQELARRLQITDRVRFVSYVPPEETAAYYALAYVAVLPSITTPRGKELWGLVANEAMNQGVPVVATEAVGAAAGGLVRHEETGFVVPERDPAALSSALQRLLDDPSLRQKLSEKARAAVARWDNEAMVQGFRDAVHYVLKQDQLVEVQKPWLA